ncbi:Gfo/Idh/MocA family protein [Frigoribacterium sp. 2-23]|uniref:Gfo/Idh/MocA family protein n=1 Tax=Frigoribacterium sp. 2-23 TaxID=3415006 RepID=UPI003C6F09B5
MTDTTHPTPSASPSASSGAPLRAAIVGCGVIGRHHASVITDHPGITVTALVDTVLPAAVALADDLEGGGADRPVAVATLAEAFEGAEVDVVVVASPSGLHLRLAEEALEAGRHLVIEKPLDVDIARSTRFAALAREASARGLVVTVISQHRFDPASQVVAAAAHDGRFGRLTSGVASVAWYRSQPYYDSGDWRGTWELDGGGAVMNQGVHTVDLLVWMLGRPIEISAQTALLAHERVEIEDVAVATVRFESGALGVIHATTAAYPGLSVRLQVMGASGSGVIDDDRLAFFHVATTGASVGHSGVPTDESLDQSAGLVPPEHLLGGPSEPDRFRRAHSRQYDDIVGAVREGRSPGVTVDDALLSLATVKALYVSATLGRPVLVDDVLTGALDDQDVTVGVRR